MPGVTKKQDRAYFSNLDAVRFMAALMVFGSHAIRPVIACLPDLPLLKPILLVLCNGAFGVDLFFVLSGFLITHRLMEEHERKNGVNVLKFYKRRAARIWPLYFLMVLVAFVIIPAFKFLISGELVSTGHRFLYHVLFISNFDLIHLVENGVSLEFIHTLNWSVSVEEQFYLCWPLLFLLQRKYWLPALLTGLLLSASFIWFNQHSATKIYLHPLSVLLFLGGGALMAYLVKAYTSFRNFFNRFTLWHHLAVLLILIVAFCLLPEIHRQSSGIFIRQLLLVTVFSLFIVSQAFSEGNSWLDLGRYNFLAASAKYTYAFYMFQAIGIIISGKVVAMLFGTSNKALLAVGVAVFAFTVTYLLAVISYRFFESKFYSGN